MLSHPAFVARYIRRDSQSEHFLPKMVSAYPEPYDQISRVSGKWTMYFSGLQGQKRVLLTRLSKGLLRSACTAQRGVSRVYFLKHRQARSCHDSRVQYDVWRICQLHAYCEVGDSNRPHAERHTYHTAALQAPLKAISVSLPHSRIHPVFVGPAASFESEQTKVRSSTRATIAGSRSRVVTTRQSFSFSFVRVPE